MNAELKVIRLRVLYVSILHLKRGFPAQNVALLEVNVSARSKFFDGLKFRGRRKDNCPFCSPSLCHDATRTIVCVCAVWSGGELGEASGVTMQRVSRCWTAAFTAFTRTKTVDVQRLHSTELKRCLNVVDLIALGQSVSAISVWWNALSVHTRSLGKIRHKTWPLPWVNPHPPGQW